MRFSLIVIALLTLTACVDVDSLVTSLEVEPAQISDAETRSVQAQLVSGFKDPASAQFRNVRGYKVSNGDSVLCGEVNGKNSFGAYVGFKPFFVRFQDGVVKLMTISGATMSNCARVEDGYIMITNRELQS